MEVCPTGIDIRNGTQLECVNCTACIDACNAVMERVGFAKGLIRYASHRGIEEGTPLRLTPRIIGYSAVLTALLFLLTLLLVGRSDAEATILRPTGVMYQELDNGMIRNLYNIKVINKTFRAMPIRLELKEEGGAITMIGGDLMLPEEGFAETSFFVDLPRTVLTAKKEIVIGVYGNDRLIEEIKTRFPAPRDL